MMRRNPLSVLLIAIALSPLATFAQSTSVPIDATAGWVKYEHNPILTDQYGTLFDICALRDNGVYRLYVSWRPQKSIVLFESKDGIHFSGPPKTVLGPAPTGWEDEVNRPSVVKRPDGYHLWYTGQSKDSSSIGYATSPDGVHWKRSSDKPVLSPAAPWEKTAIVCPDVVWDGKLKLYRMWYSAGPRVESDAMGYATSPDGVTWTRSGKNPIFSGDPSLPWEKERAVAGDVEKLGDWYYMFYIGFHDMGHAQLGLARSRDGVSGWQRLPQNPIIRLGTGMWDTDSCYKPFALFDGAQWLLWYGGRNGTREQIGVAIHAGADLGFPSSQ
jgi:predicted GH43/DUF377 family glycosyl hydrolase